MNWKHYVTETAETEIESDYFVRTATLALAGSNWMILYNMLLYVGGHYSATEAFRVGMFYAIAVLIGFVVIVQLPAIARVIERRVLSEPSQRTEIE